VLLEDRVVLVDEGGERTGWAEKSTIHSASTPLHLAFSCYLFDEAGRVLVTRRALTKRTWPGVWTNSFCGHPGPGEPMTSAIERHARDELGVDIGDIREVLPDFRYTATDASGIVENEICPVYVARSGGLIVANPNEVAEWAWIDATDLIAAVDATPRLVSPWSALQVPLMRAELLAMGGVA